MKWVEADFKGKTVWAQVHDGGNLVVEGGRKGFLRFCFAVCPPLPPTYAASVLMVARSTPHAEARG